MTETSPSLSYMVDPQGRVRFFGIYSAKVVDNKDPLKKGRLKLQILQPTGTSTTGWAPACLGAISQVNYPYGTFISTSTQTVSGANTANTVTNLQAVDTNKTRLSGTKIYVEETGDYNLYFSTMFNKSSANSAEVDIWVKVNGSNLANSNTRGHLQGNDAETVISAGLILDLKAGDYIEFAFSSTATGTALQYYGPSSNPTRPAIPGIIATLSLVGKYVPKPGTKVWATFEAGDPEYPVWIGVQQ